MTDGERRAVWFLVLVAVLGIGVRLLRSGAEAGPPASVTGIEAQIAAVEEGRAGRRGGRGGGKAPPRRAATELPRVASPLPASKPAAPARINVDVAGAGELEALPGVGPALARRIIDDRIARGAFGCLANLDSVRGIGPAMLRRLDSLVVFGGAPSTRAGKCP